MSPIGPRSAVLFDIDGTLVDTNYFHVIAWWRAFDAAGENVPMWRIHRYVGMGGDQMLKELFGEEREDLAEGHKREFESFHDSIRAFPSSAQLLRAVKGRGGVVALATSSRQEDVDVLTRAIDADDVIDVVVSKGDVEESKPAPEVFQVAMERARVEPNRALVVGDTVWDVEAARKSGLRCICVLTGGVAAAELKDAGAIEVYESPVDLLEKFDESELERLLSS